MTQLIEELSQFVNSTRSVNSQYSSRDRKIHNYFEYSFSIRFLLLKYFVRLQEIDQNFF